MRGKKRKIRIHREKPKHIPVYHSFADNFFAVVFTAFVLCTWVKSWSSFLVPDEKQAGLYMISLIAAALVWFVSYRTQKGKIAALVLMTVPCIAAALRRTFPDFLSVWLQMTAGMIYFMSGIWGSAEHPEKRKKIDGIGKKQQILSASAGLIQWLFFAALIVSVAVVSSYMGRFLDTARNTDGGSYLLVRSKLQSIIIDRAEHLFSVSGEETKKQELPQIENNIEIVQEEEIFETETGDEESSQENFSVTSADVMENLDSITSFIPQAVTPEEVIIDQPPDGVFYLMKHVGINYTGDRWEKAETAYQEPERDLTEEELRMFTSYPENLTKLKDLCTDWQKDSSSMIDRQIRDCLNEMAVYDTNPGRTPEGKDFAEYFLFENKKGFCVHFATAAVLLWRMNGYPAVYVQGYAIPEDAFEKQADGRYKTVINGSMGHAWCRVYSSDTGMWTNMEYTPDSGNIQMPVKTDMKQDENMTFGGVPEEFCCFAGVFLLCICLAGIVFLQAWIRNWHMGWIIRKNNETALIIMYRNLLRTADFLPEKTKKKENRLSSVETVPDIPANLKLYCPQIRAKEWKWMRECVLKLLFYHMEEYDIHQEMLRLYHRILLSAEKHMTFPGKISYQFIYCLDPFFLYGRKRNK